MFSGKGYYTKGKGAVDYVKPTYHGHGKYLAHKVKLYFEDERHRTDRSFSFMCNLKLTMCSFPLKSIDPSVNATDIFN